MSKNAEAQSDEILALKSIYEDDVEMSGERDERASGRILIKIDTTSITSVFCSATGKSEKIHYLPPLCLTFTLPSEYPSHSPPEFTLSCLWLDEIQLSCVSDHLDALWCANEGSEILFTWINFLQHELVDFLALESPLCLPDEVSSVLLAHSDVVFQTEFVSSSFFCGICFEDTPGDKCVQFSSACEHVYCAECMRLYFEGLIRDGNVLDITCPAGNCDETATQTRIQLSVSVDLYRRYDRLQLQYALDSSTDVQMCPARQCGLAVILDRDGLGICPHCQFVFCGACRMTSHGIEPCRTKSVEARLYEEYSSKTKSGQTEMMRRYGKKTIEDMLRNNTSEKYIQESGGKQCPTCKYYIQKMEGCNKVYCGKCRTYFCWLCLCVISRSDPYGHYRDVDSECYNKLFLGAPPVDPFLPGGEWVQDQWRGEDDERGIEPPPAEHHPDDPDLLLTQIQQMNFADIVIPDDFSPLPAAVNPEDPDFRLTQIQQLDFGQIVVPAEMVNTQY